VSGRALDENDAPAVAASCDTGKNFGHLSASRVRAAHVPATGNTVGVSWRGLWLLAYIRPLIPQRSGPHLFIIATFGA
jgi:hypothetical protein